MESKWLECGNTLIYMRKVGDNFFKIPEWHPEVQVTLRKIYDAMPPMWYVWDIDEEGSIIGKFATREDAVNFVQSYYSDTDTTTHSFASDS